MDEIRRPARGGARARYSDARSCRCCWSAVRRGSDQASARLGPQIVVGTWCCAAVCAREIKRRSAAASAASGGASRRSADTSPDANCPRQRCINLAAGPDARGWSAALGASKPARRISCAQTLSWGPTWSATPRRRPAGPPVWRGAVAALRGPLASHERKLRRALSRRDSARATGRRVARPWSTAPLCGLCTTGRAA